MAEVIGFVVCFFAAIICGIGFGLYLHEKWSVEDQAANLAYIAELLSKNKELKKSVEAQKQINLELVDENEKLKGELYK